MQLERSGDEGFAPSARGQKAQALECTRRPATDGLFAKCPRARAIVADDRIEDLLDPSRDALAQRPGAVVDDALERAHHALRCAGDEALAPFPRAIVDEQR